MQKPFIFISYRIADSLSNANALSLSLEIAFGEGAAFHDKSSLKPGMDWPIELAEKVKNASVVLILVADAEKWLGIDTSTGSRRIDDPKDWVRKEVETALSDAQKLVIPILIDGARWPDKKTLPHKMRPVLNKQSKQLRTANWSDDIQPLIKVIREFLAKETKVQHSITDLERKGVEQQLDTATRKLSFLENARLREIDISGQFKLDEDISELKGRIAELKVKLQQ